MNIVIGTLGPLMGHISRSGVQKTAQMDWPLDLIRQTYLRMILGMEASARVAVHGLSATLSTGFGGLQ